MLNGSFKTIPLPDLMQWVGGARKTGTLQVERNRITKLILFEDGQVVGCSSDDPPERLGQFLINRGKITEDQLREALDLQEISGKHLGTILVDMETISAEDLSSHLEAKAEEIIYSLFEWDEAAFRFIEGQSDPANVFPIRVGVQDVLLRGLKRFDEMSLIREVFPNNGVILRPTKRKPPDAVFENKMARRIYELVNDDRTVAEILLHAHGSEYAVLKFLYDLHEGRYVAIARMQELDPQPPAAASPAVEATPPAAQPASGEAEPALDWTPDIDHEPVLAPETPVEAGAPSAGDDALDDLVDDLDAMDAPIDPEPLETPATATASHPAEPATAVSVAVAAAVDAIGAEAQPAGSDEVGLEPVEKSDAHYLARQLDRAQAAIDKASYEAAIDILDEVYDRFPGDDTVRDLSRIAEAGFVERAYRHLLPASKVPVLTKPVDDLDLGNISPSEFFLLSRIDGTWDVKSIIQIAPLREVDAIRTLRRMREAGVIELREPEEKN
ncbi:MAG: DUF4388 domain-containing protein [bacterium]|nr:DUF4388 domain-containing protein [bacterium]